MVLPCLSSSSPFSETRVTLETGISEPAFTTVTRVFDIFEPSTVVTDIEADPAPTAVAFPLASMLIIRSSVDFHTTLLSVALSGSTFAVKVNVSPTFILFPAGIFTSSTDVTAT